MAIAFSDRQGRRRWWFAEGIGNGSKEGSTKMARRNGRWFGSRVRQDRRIRRSSVGSMFEALELRCLFSFGVEAVARAPLTALEHLQPVAAVETSVAVRASLVVEWGASGRFAQGELHEELIVDVRVLALQAPQPLLITAPRDAQRGGYSGHVDNGRDDAPDAVAAADKSAYMPFRPYTLDDKSAGMSLDRVESGNMAPRPGPVLAAESRPQPALLSFASEGAHQGGGMAMRVTAAPAGMELQLLRPGEAPASPGIAYDKSASLPRLVSLDAIERTADPASEFEQKADGKTPWPAVALEADSTLALRESASQPPASLSIAAPSAAWGSLLPLIPQLSPDAAQLSEAFQAVFADLDDLGGELVSSLASHDRLILGLGAAGVAYYVAGHRLHYGAAAPEAVAGQGRSHVRAGRSLTFARLQNR